MRRGESCFGGGGKKRLETPELRALAEYAFDHGIPWSALAEWSDDDLAQVLAVLARRGESCAQCGTRESDWVDPVTRHPVDDPSFEVVAMVCHGCRARDLKSAELSKLGPRDRAGGFVTMKRKG